MGQFSSGVPLGGANSPITQLVDGRKVVAAAGTPEQISSTKVPCTYVEVQALELNTKQVCVGGPSIDETAATRLGVVLQPGESRVFYVTDLSMIWVDVQVNGEGVGYSLGK